MEDNPYIQYFHPHESHEISSATTAFFESKGMKRVYLQHHQAILAACEDPTTIATYEYAGGLWPHKQTNQMHLEEMLLKNPTQTGYFCDTTSYRWEKNPKLGRHQIIFPMIEFEIAGGMNELAKFESELLTHLGYGDTPEYPKGDYCDIAKKYGVTELDHEHEMKLWDEYGSVFLLQNFPFYTSPFWNMSANFETQISNKIDVIMHGIETIGSAERSCDPVTMRKQFYEISEGKYAGILFNLFGKERVERELDAFLSYDFPVRSGGGIGVSRLLRSMKLLHEEKKVF